MNKENVSGLVASHQRPECHESHKAEDDSCNQASSRMSPRRCFVAWVFVMVMSAVISLNLAGRSNKVGSSLRTTATTSAALSITDSQTQRVTRPTLRFQKRSRPFDTDEADDSSWNYTFKIVQITDIHLGEAQDTDWGPEQDASTWKAIDAVLKHEDPVDLIVLGGDQLTANDCRYNATAYYQQLGEFLMPYNIPWALVFGNHDDMWFQYQGKDYPPAKHSRQDLLEVDRSFPLSLTKSGPQTIDGTSNYVLDIHLPRREQQRQHQPKYPMDDHDEFAISPTIAAQVYFLDSGGGSIPEQVSDSQVSWFRQRSSESTVPAMAFQHIPTVAHNFVENGSCQGFHGDGVAPIGYDGGILDAMEESGRFYFLAVGHNHGNDYCCPYGANASLHLCFGRHSGYGGYGGWDRGSRVYELTLQPQGLKEEWGSGSESMEHMQWKSWVRMESGDIVDQVIPSTME